MAERVELEPEPTLLLTPEQMVAIKDAMGELGSDIAAIDGQLGDAKNNGGREIDGEWVPYKALGSWISQAVAAKRVKQRQIKDLRLRLLYQAEKRRELDAERAEERRRNAKARYEVIGDAFTAMRLLADTFRAACDLVDDDSDEHFEALAELVEVGRNHGFAGLEMNRPSERVGE